jgi:hypothetical protein
MPQLVVIRARQQHLQVGEKARIRKHKQSVPGDADATSTNAPTTTVQIVVNAVSFNKTCNLRTQCCAATSASGEKECKFGWRLTKSQAMVIL